MATRKGEKSVLLGVNDVARLSGVPRTTVQRMIGKGDLVADADGKLPESAVERAKELFADADPTKRRAPAVEVPSADGAVAELQHSKRVAELKLKLAQTDVKELDAKLKKIQLAFKQGVYVEVAEVRKNATETASIVTARFRTLGSRVTPRIESLVARAKGAPRGPEIEAVVCDEVERILVELQGARWVA
jgi:hypothetical protein